MKDGNKKGKLVKNSIIKFERYQLSINRLNLHPVLNGEKRPQQRNHRKKELGGVVKWGVLVKG